MVTIIDTLRVDSDKLYRKTGAPFSFEPQEHSVAELPSHRDTERPDGADPALDGGSRRVRTISVVAAVALVVLVVVLHLTGVVGGGSH